MKVVYSPEAVRNLREISAYIHSRNRLQPKLSGTRFESPQIHSANFRNSDIDSCKRRSESSSCLGSDT
jgi:hypothetical protein